MKNMLLLLSASLFVGSAFGQKDSCGIFTSASDYRTGKLTYAVNYKNERQRIKDYLFLDADKVKVKHGGETHLLDKNNLYGYRNIKGQDFRFVGQRTYLILSPGEPIILYKYGEPQADPIKNPPTLYNRYYFSTNEDNSPINLTRANLKKAFSNNTKFVQAIDRNFRSDDELVRFDRVHKRYLVNQLLEESQK